MQIKRISSQYITSTPLPVNETYSIHTQQENQLYQKLQVNGNLILLSGASGTGKTYLARRLFYRMQKEYDYLAWVEYNTDIESDFLTYFNNSNGNNGKLTFSNIINELTKKNKKTIIFIDNVNENAFKDDALSRITGLGITIVLTSRCAHIPPYETYKIDKPTIEECIKLFYMYYKYDQKQIHEEIIKDLVNLLDYNVMLIILIARIMDNEQKLINFHQILSKTENESLFSYELLSESIIKLMIENANLSQNEFQVLKCFAIFPTEEVSYDIKQWFDISEDSINQLVAKGLIYENINNKSYILHDIIKKHILKNYGVNDVVENFLSYIYSNWYSVDILTISNLQYKIEIIEAVLNIANYNCSHYTEVCFLIGNLYSEIKKYEHALTYYKRAKESEENKTQLHLKLLTKICNEISSIYNAKGIYDKSLEYYLYIENYFNSTENVDLLDRALNKHYIGSAYHDLCEFSKALCYYEQALDLLRNSNNDMELADCYNSIGTLYHDMGEYSNANKYYIQALEIWQTDLLSNRDNLSSVFNNIGEIFHELGDYKNAIKHLEQALSYHNNNDIDTSIIYNNIGNIYRDMKEFRKALKLQKTALNIQEKAFGSYHPEIARSYNNIGAIYYKTEELDKALYYYKKGLEIREMLLGEDNPLTAISYNNVGKVLCKKQQYYESQKYHKKALAIISENFPEDHPYIADTYFYISDVLFAIEEKERSLTYRKKSYFTYLKKLGKDHPKTTEVLETLQKSFEQNNGNEGFEKWLNSDNFLKTNILLDNSNQC